MKVRVALLLGCAFIPLGCGSDRSATDVVVRRGLDVAGVTVTDVVAPPDGDGLPVVVMLHGTGGERAVMEPLAREVAARDVVVYLPAWPVIEQLDAEPPIDAEPYHRQTEAVVCALRYARRTARSYGGDPERLTLFGHSGGATVGARVALVGSAALSPGIDCDAGIAHEPERFIATAGDFFGVYQDATKCPDLFEPFDPFEIAVSNDDLEVRLIHGYRDRMVDARVSLLFDDHLVECAVDSAVIATDTGHSELRDPTVPAGAFVADQIAALAHGRESVFDRPAAAGIVEFADDDSCRYDGPVSMPRREPLGLEIRNETSGELLWFALARLRPEVPVTLADLRADRTSNGAGPPPFVSYGGFSAVPAGSTRFIDWVFVDGDADWAIYCMRDPDPDHPMSWPSFVLWGGPAMRPVAIISPADRADRAGRARCVRVPSCRSATLER